VDTTTQLREHPHNRLRGIGFMVAAVFVFAIMDALMKRLSTHYGPLQIACMRSLSSFAFLLLPIAWRGSWAELKASAPALHALRGVLGIVMLASFVFAVHRLTLAQTYSLFLAAPLLMTALSVPIHGERVTGRRWLAIICGMSGVLLILQPWGQGAFSMVAAAAAAVATVCYSLSALTVRSLGRRNTSMSMVFWYLALVGTGAGLLAISQWHAVELGDWKWLAAVGISGALGQLWLTEAFRRAPPSVVGPFEYTAMLWAFGIDWIFWSASPSAGLLFGAAIVVASGIVIIIDEHRLAELAVNPACSPP
jgi:drug/metabolite transporter (DMT)-like permease